MKYSVHVVKNATGESRDYATSYDDDHDGGLIFMWTDGNYCCDCNRHLFFEQAGGADGDDIEDIECGETAYSAPYAIREDGKRIPLDEGRR